MIQNEGQTALFAKPIHARDGKIQEKNLKGTKLFPPGFINHHRAISIQLPLISKPQITNQPPRRRNICTESSNFLSGIPRASGLRCWCGLSGKSNVMTYKAVDRTWLLEGWGETTWSKSLSKGGQWRGQTSCFRQAGLGCPARCHRFHGKFPSSARGCGCGSRST